MTNRAAMSARTSTAHDPWNSNHRFVEEILKDMHDTVNQVVLASDFLMMAMDGETRGSQMQLSCLIRERTLVLKDQIIELNRILNRDLYSCVEQ